MAQRFRERLQQILSPAVEGDRASRAVDLFILGLIALNILAMILETVQAVYEKSSTVFWAFEVFSVLIFSIEYVARVWVCVETPGRRHPLWGRLRYIISPLALMDLAAIAPFYIPFVSIDLRFLRIIRLSRMFRIAKLGRYSAALHTLSRVFALRKEELITSMFLLALLLVCASSLMYFAENPAQPERFSSIPAAMWWGIVTLTTVGYGDVYPLTVAGKVLASIVSIAGIGLFALPAGILGAGLIEELHSKRGRHTRCPHCGRPLRNDVSTTEASVTACRVPSVPTAAQSSMR